MGGAGLDPAALMQAAEDVGRRAATAQVDGRMPAIYLGHGDAAAR